MHRIITSRRESFSALTSLRASLTDSTGKPVPTMWSFPGGGRIKLKTWALDNVIGHPLAIGIGANSAWETRTPVLVARSEPHSGMTPVVEVNVPLVAGTPNRAVAGCFYEGPEGELVLAHRGSSFTVRGGKIPKAAIHERFSKWLVCVQDGDREANVIPIAPAGPEIASQLALFADEVVSFKDQWRGFGHAKKSLDVRGTWRDEIRFPETISRAVDATSASFEYRHGPIQLSLQHAVARCVPERVKVRLNQRVDLALLDNGAIAAIFEVKTNLGAQLYAGIGQLLWYRELLAKASTPLFFVVPQRAFKNDSDVGARLARLGITLLVENDSRFARWDGASLRKALSEARIATR